MDEELQSPYRPLDTTVRPKSAPNGELTSVTVGNTGLRIQFHGTRAIQHYTPDHAQTKVEGSETKHAKIYAAALFELLEWWKDEKTRRDLPSKIVGVTHETMHQFWGKLLEGVYHERAGFQSSDGHQFVLEIDQLIENQERMDKLQEWAESCKKSNYQVLP